MSTITELSLVRNSESATRSLEPADLREAFKATASQVLTAVEDLSRKEGAVSFREAEQMLRLLLMALGRAALTLFLALREKRVATTSPAHVERGGRLFRKAPAQVRSLTTWFGVVPYGRTYFREVAKEERHGFYPLDEELGLSADRFSWSVLSFGVRLALMLSFAEARKVLSECVPQAPSTEVLEQTVLGLGRYTADWFEQAPAPTADEGNVLVIMIDSKGAPTATETELKRRRGKRWRRRRPASPRHRGRIRRGHYPKPPRRKKGDKSKHAKMATLVVMYTLKRQGSYLLGPRNRWVYASFAPKRHAFEIARREAAKRGFGPETGKIVQLVTDGDDDLAVYAKQYLPQATHTLDVMHAIEKLWEAGDALYPEGSRELTTWVEEQKDRLYGGRPEDIVAELQMRLDAVPKSGPGNKGKRKRLAGALGYLSKRLHMMPYKELLAADMEIASGPVEGAVKNLIGKRCDHGGMRWIKERVEAVVQLRCIEANGDWEAFLAFVAHRVHQQAMATGARVRLQSSTPAPLPRIEEAA